MKELTLADYVARRDALAASAPVPDGYRDHHLRHRVPGGAPGVVRAPAGHADVGGAARRARPPGVGVDPERIREAEQRQVVDRPARADGDGDRPGRLRGRVSDVRVDDSDPAHGQVGITIVDPGTPRAGGSGWRSRLATHDLAVATYPGLVSVDTSNAEVNTWMNAVNEALGYRTIETLLELQKKL